MGAPHRGAAEARLRLISAALDAHDFADNGLMSGRAGRALFRFQLDVADQDFAADLDAITSFEGYAGHGYASGIAGGLWQLAYLDRKGRLDAAALVAEDAVEFFCEAALELLDGGNYDPLHGAIGHINFLLEDDRLSPTRTAFLDRFIEALAAKAIVDERGARWRHLGSPGSHDLDDRLAASMGLAHGQAGVMAFLLKCKAKGVRSRTLDDLLEEAALFAFHACADLRAAGSPISLPAFIIDGEYNVGRKLAWCYGDLSSASVLLKVATALRRPDWRQMALDVLKDCAAEDFVEAFPMRDACFCHGTAGAAYMFGKLHKETGIDVFKRARDRWIAQTLAFGGDGGDAAGYRFFDGETHIPSFGLLEGIAGIGLALQAWLRDFDADSTDWDGCFYLS